MKKALLSLVAAGLVGAVVAPAALAEGELGANRNTNESGYWVENNLRNGLVMLTNLKKVKFLK